MDGDLSKDNSSFVGASSSPKIMGYFPLLWTIGCSARSPSCTSTVPGFFLPRTTTNHSHVTSV